MITYLRQRVGVTHSLQLFNRSISLKRVHERFFKNDEQTLRKMGVTHGKPLVSVVCGRTRNIAQGALPALFEVLP